MRNDQSNDLSSARRTFEDAGNEARLSLVAEFWLFVKQNKKWWLIPILLVFGIVSVLVILGSTGAAPFIYTMF
jgi:hypothetical protein